LLSAFILLLIAHGSLFSVFAAPRAARSEWVKQKSGTLAWLRSVFFIDGTRGWAVGGKGALLSTVDGGASWQARLPPTEDTLRDIFFTDELTGWIVCERNIYLLRTKEEPRAYLLWTGDGGETWSRVEIEGLDVDAALSRVVFADAAHGWALGERGLLYVTLDGGTTWTRQQTPTRHLLLDAHFLNARQGWIAGAGSTLLRTADGGATWRAGRIEAAAMRPRVAAQAISPSPRLPAAPAEPAEAASLVRFNAVSFTNARRGWAVGAGGAVCVTYDGGATWRAQESGVEVELFDVKFFDASEGYAAGDGGTIIHTTDGGATWAVERTNTTRQLERLFFAGRARGWAVGFGGAILALK
jgi:photosystem II stability/assembly factor-like uncharacterized protein